MNDEQIAIVTLNLIPEIGPHTFHNLISRFGSAESVLKASREELADVEHVSQPLAGRIAAAQQSVDVEKEIALAQKCGVDIVTSADAEYPESLKNYHDYPPVLYVRGMLQDTDTFSVSVVGTRKPTNYGVTATKKIVEDLSREGITIISGLARGIDIEAHKAAMAMGTRTLAVLGNGQMHHYPPEHKKYEAKIVKAGALISEFPMAYPPDKTTFPRRNRLIAALSLATLVVEAPIKSGALITAKYCADQGKDVFVVPGPIFSKNYEGNHYLIKSGARLVENAADIIEEIKPLQAWVASRKVPQSTVTPRSDALLTAADNDILAILETDVEGISIDSLAERLSYTFSDLSIALLNLELKGFIRSLPGKVYVKNH